MLDFFLRLIEYRHPLKPKKIVLIIKLILKAVYSLLKYRRKKEITLVYEFNLL